jgi:hypothetical protein
MNYQKAWSQTPTLIDHLVMIRMSNCFQIKRVSPLDEGASWAAGNDAQ